MGDRQKAETGCPLATNEWALLLSNELNSVRTQFAAFISVTVALVAISGVLWTTGWQSDPGNTLIWLIVVLVFLILGVWSVYVQLWRMKPLGRLLRMVILGEVTTSEDIRSLYFTIPRARPYPKTGPLSEGGSG